jgi:hypothetical protein
MVEHYWDWGEAKLFWLDGGPRPLGVLLQTPLRMPLYVPLYQTWGKGPHLQTHIELQTRCEDYLRTNQQDIFRKLLYSFLPVTTVSHLPTVIK